MNGAVEKCGMSLPKQRHSSPAAEFATIDFFRLSTERPALISHVDKELAYRLWREREEMFPERVRRSPDAMDAFTGTWRIFQDAPSNIDGTEINAPRDLRAGGR